MTLRIFVCLLLLSTLTGYTQEKKQITLEDIFSKGTFRSESVSGFRSMKDGSYYSEINKDGELQQVRFSDGKVEKVLVNLKKLVYNGKTIAVDDYQFNEKENSLLLFTEGESIYRRSTAYNVYVYDLENGSLNPLRDEKVLHATFSPMGDKIAYVLKNNIYINDLSSGEVLPVTKDGSYAIINGNCDWVYEEEFEFSRAYEWAADGSYLAYYRFDQSDVPEYNFAIYDKLYPTDYKYKYPKAGEPNSKVSIRMYSIENARSIRCRIGDESDIYIPRIKVNPFNNHLVIYHMNRLQNHLTLIDVEPGSNRTDTIYEETNTYYVEVNDRITFLKKRNAFVYTSEKDGHMHLYLHDIDENKSTAITHGDWEVTDLYGVDEEKGLVYYASTEMASVERNLYVVGLNGEGKKNLTPAKGWHMVEFSHGFSYFLDRYSKLNTPVVISIFNGSGDLVRVLKDNSALKAKMQEYNLSNAELMTVPNADGVDLNAWIIKPASFDPSKKYPLLMFQYSGPGSQSVMNSFSIRDYWWNQMLAQNGYIVVCVDGTGTGYRGEEFKKKTYLQLGNLESNDQIAAARYFASQSWIDKNRIGIWGWSFGGYMSSICLLKGADVFKTAIAVAPVTNWRYYDNIYTERYMRTPAENAKGYDDNSPVNMVDKLKGNYLLIHGTADDNVHYQNSIMMIDALQKANKDFDSECYPNKNHGISGGTTRLHLYRRMTRYLMENL